VIPCFNEADAIGSLLDEMQALALPCDPLVIDDGSTDGTYAVASRRGLCVRLQHNLGIGGAVQTGIKYAARQGYDFCVQIDGDGQHPPDQVLTLLKAHAALKTNIVVGSRYRRHDTDRSTWARRLGGRIIARALAGTFGAGPISDPTSGLRLMDRKAIAFFAERYPHDFPEPISIAWAFRHGLTVGETPVKMRARDHGASSIGGWKALSYMVRVLFYILLARLEPRNTPPNPATGPDR
jgi:glycosyltransferase involved in cell wall biosynthesis